MHGEYEPITPYRQVYLVDSTHYRFKILEQLVFWDVLIKDAVDCLIDQVLPQAQPQLVQVLQVDLPPLATSPIILELFSQDWSWIWEASWRRNGPCVWSGVDPNIKSLNAFLPQIHWKGKWCTDSYFIWWNSLLVIRDHLMTNDLKYLWISTLVTAVILKAEVKVEKGEQYYFSLILFYQTVTDLLPLPPVREAQLPNCLQLCLFLSL